MSEDNDPVQLETTRLLAEALLENAEDSVLRHAPDEPEAHPVWHEIQRLKREIGLPKGEA